MASWKVLKSEQGEGSTHSNLPLEADSAEEGIPGQTCSVGKRMRGLAAFSVLVGSVFAWVFFSTSTHGQVGSRQSKEFMTLAEEYSVQEFKPENLKKPNYNKKDGVWCVGLNAVGFDLHPTARREMGTATVPSKDALRYFNQQGANCFRLAITWERLQEYAGSDILDPVDGVEDVVDFVTKTLGAYVIIDPHNNDEGLKFNGVDVERSDFVNLWKAITKKWGNNDKCIFGLYNEPRFGLENGIKGYFDPNVLDKDGAVIEFWRQWMQSAIDAIRALGSTNLILVPGLHWTGCADWSGNYWWGETLDGKPNQGNSRLAALTDPENNIAYDVHQYMDMRYTGQEEGCKGHDLNFYCKDDPGCNGADMGLQATINWAKTYKKKMFMTEIGSYPAMDGSEGVCKSKMCNYLQQMHESGVFIGYTVWQFGCPQCDADQWTKKPLNLDWYRIAEFSNLTKCKDAGTNDCPKPTCPASEGLLPAPAPIEPPVTCSEPHEDCRETLCCKDAAKTCMLKNEYWASCRDSCIKGEKDEFGEEWLCEPLGHAPENVPAAHDVDCDVDTPCTDTSGSMRDVCIAEARLTCCENLDKSREECCQLESIKAVFPGTGNAPYGSDKCKKQCSDNWKACGVWQCCADDSFTCRKKNDGYAQCRDKNAACPPPEDSEEWSCATLPLSGPTDAPPVVDLSCSMDSESCSETQCCQNKDKKCYEKNLYWSSCRPTDTCVRGKWEVEQGTEWHTNWTCAWSDKTCKFENVGNDSDLKPVEACASLGDGWEPVPTMERCRTVRVVDQAFEEFKVVDAESLEYHPAGCSTSLASKFKLGKWNSNTNNKDVCSKSGPCVCQKCE